MKKIIFALMLLLTACVLCTGIAADDGFVFTADDIYTATSTGGGLAISDKLVNADNTVYFSVEANGQVDAGQDGTQINIKVSEMNGADFLLKDYPIFKMSYRSNIAADASLDFNLGMNYVGAATRLWGSKPAYTKDDKKSELILDLSKSFSGGENLGAAYSWDNVDDDSPVNYIRLKPYYSNAAMVESEHFYIEYIGFFKTEDDAKNYKHEGGLNVKMTELDLNFGAVRKYIGESFELVPVPSPSYASVDSVTYSSENPNIASVDANGKVTAVSAGDTYIVAKCADGLEAKCHVFVLAGKLPAVHFVPKSVASSNKITVNCLGDSITTYAPSPEGGKNYHDWWAAEYNVNNNDYGISGASLTSNGQNPFVDRFMDMEDGAELVIVKGGTNDFGGTSVGDINDKKTSTYAGALRTLMDGLIEKYPESQIVFLTPIKRCESGQTPATKNGYGNTLNDYADMVVALGELYGITTVNIYTPEELDFTSKVISKPGHDSEGKWHNAVCEDDRMPDGLHPSGKGHKILADYILNELVEKGVITVHENAFKDTINHWGCANIDYVVGRGLFNGVSESEFNPNGTMTRGMLVTVLARLAGDTENKSEYSYKDVSTDAWFAPGVSFAYSNGIVDSGDAFRPDDNVTREELADMLYRYAQNTGKNVELADIDFTDADSITESMKDSVAYCVNAGIIKGYNDNTFKPTNSATRAEVATMILRFVNAK